MTDRVGEVTRKTKETEIDVRLALDGTGKADSSTGIGFFDHMLKGFARHGGRRTFRCDQKSAREYSQLSRKAAKIQLV